jgi:hypothetical protein
MKRPASRRALRPALPALLAALCLSTGCDKGGDEEKKDDASAKADDEAEPKKDEAKAADADEKEAEPKEDDKKIAAAAEDAKKKAEEDAKAAEEAKKLAEAEEAKKKQPLILDGLTVTASGGGAFGGSSNGSLELKAKAKINEKLASSTYVHVKSLCKKDSEVVSDVGYLNAHYSKALDQYESGEEAEVTGTLYSQGGLDKALSPCQMEFRLGGFGGGISVPVGEVCYDGEKTTDGKCDPEILPVAMSGVTKPMEVSDLTVAAGGGYGSSSSLDVGYMIKVAKAQDSSARLTMKSTCEVDGVRFVDLSQVNMMSGPFAYESGESLARSASVFWNPAFAFTAAPTLCDVSFDLWTTKAGAWGTYDHTEIQRSCFRDGKVGSGACDPSRATTGTAAKVTAENVELTNVAMSLQEPYGSTGKFQVQLAADATVKEFIEQNEGVQAQVTCKVGSEKRVETAYLFSVELYYLEPGETTRMSSTSFTSPPMDSKPKSCEVAFTGGQRFAGAGVTPVDLGKYCLKKDKIKKGKC